MLRYLLKFFCTLFIFHCPEDSGLRVTTFLIGRPFCTKDGAVPTTYIFTKVKKDLVKLLSSIHVIFFRSIYIYKPEAPADATRINDSLAFSNDPCNQLAYQGRGYDGWITAFDKITSKI